MGNKNQQANKGGGAHKVAPPPAAKPEQKAPELDVLATTAEKAGGAPSVAPPAPSVEGEKKDSQELKDSWKLKTAAGKSEKAENNDQPAPDRKIAGKFRKFQNLKEKK